MPSLCLLCVAILIRALYLWVTLKQDEEDYSKEPADKKSKKKKSEVNNITGNEDLDEKLVKDKHSDTEDEDRDSDYEDSEKTEKDETSNPEQTLRQRRKCSPKKTKKSMTSDSGVPEDNKSKELRNKQKEKSVESAMSIVNIGANYLLVHLLGYAVMNSPMLFSKIGEHCLVLKKNPITSYFNFFE